MDTNDHKFFSSLVAAKSVSSKDPSIDTSNKAAAMVVASMLEDAGMKVQTTEVPGLEDKHNVIATAGPDHPGSGLLLAGHTDTVPCDPDNWDTDPFILTEKDGCLHGLGACDMKGFFVAVRMALRKIDLGSLRKPLRVWATAEEECGMEGAIHAADTAVASSAALVGEPTSVKPVRGHKGCMADSIVCKGRTGHASVPSGGANALEAVNRVMTALREDIDSSAGKLADKAFEPAEPTINFGLCRAGDAFNRIPDVAELWVDRRIMPGENVDDVRRHMREVAAAAAGQIEGVQIEFSELARGFDASLTDKDAPIIKEAERLTGLQVGTVAYGTEAPYYSAKGMDVLILGAGGIGYAHKPNEMVAISEIDRVAEVICGLVEAICMGK